MRIFTCPKCHQLGIAWDARSRTFLCHSLTCGAWFDPAPLLTGAKRLEYIAALTRGAFEPTQAWFDRQSQTPSHDGIATEASCGAICVS